MLLASIGANRPIPPPRGRPIGIVQRVFPVLASSAVSEPLGASGWAKAKYNVPPTTVNDDGVLLTIVRHRRLAVTRAQRCHEAGRSERLRQACRLHGAI